jgi:hypothetical protein
MALAITVPLGGVPNENPKQLTDARESVDSSIDEPSLQFVLFGVQF